MKICISSTGENLKSQVDPRFGRAAHLLLVDTDGNGLRQLEGATRGAHGAGIQAARSVIDAGATALVTGQIGPNAYDVLDAAGIAVYLTPGGSVEGAIQDLTGGRLEKISAPSGRPHGGTGR